MSNNSGVSKLVLETALRIASSDADKKETDAGFDGRSDDGGASRLRDLIQAYNDGRNGRIPKFLDEYLKEARRQTDPEYADYVRMQKKFG